MAIQNLSELLASAAEDPSGNAVTVYDPNNENGITLTYRSLLALAAHKAIQLQQKLGDVASKVVLIYFHNHLDGIVWFWAVVLTGAIPCICPPLAADPEQRLHYVRHLYSLLETPLVITTRSLALSLPKLQGLRIIITGKNAVIICSDRDTAKERTKERKEKKH
jgi:acyl-CoA synthetase (AMP-forming)/AMP-acid ligase II